MGKIIHITHNIRPGGGPQGYLYNLNEASKGGKHLFSVMSDSISSSRDNTSYLHKKIPDVLLRHLKPIKYIVMLMGFSNLKCENLAFQSREEMLCAHSVTVAARLLRSRKKWKNKKILLMPHGPVNYSDEVMDDVNSLHGISFISKLYRKVLLHLENRTFENVDGIIVAAKEGLESYSNLDKIDMRKCFEIMTGLPGLNCNLSKKNSRELLEIPENRTVVGYFGRFNNHKGFDYFLSEIKRICDHPSLFFISAGAGPLTPEQIPNYKNFGWRKDINILITACDVVVIPNRSTYFDLLPLEVLSLSRPVMVSESGGNKKLAAVSEGVINFKLKDGELASSIEKFSNMPQMEREQLENIAGLSFENLFSQEIFLARHDILSQRLSDYFNQEVPSIKVMV